MKTDCLINYVTHVVTMTKTIQELQQDINILEAQIENMREDFKIRKCEVCGNQSISARQYRNNEKRLLICDPCYAKYDKINDFWSYEVEQVEEED